MIPTRILRTTAVAALAGGLIALPAPATIAAPAGTGVTVATHAATPLKKHPKPQPQYLNSCRPTRAALPASVLGNPKLKPGRTSNAAKGLYVWNDGKGWKVRLTHNLQPVAGKPTLVEVRGRITATKPITRVRLVRLEDKQVGEWVAVQRPKRRALNFRFVNGGYIDGLNFAAGCSGKLTFTVWEVTKVNGKVTRTPLPVFVGASRLQLTTSTVPALAATPTDVSRFTVLRALVKKS
jgi:hypothetical protein